jgi:peptidoglycan hydrolase CwlO-like protein
MKHTKNQSISDSPTSSLGSLNYLDGIRTTQVRRASWKIFTNVSILTVATLLVVGGSFVPNVNADSFDEQIKALNQQNAQTQSSVSQLQVQASSYQDVINQLQAQISQIQQQIAQSQSQQASLQQQIDANQKELDNQKTILAVDIKASYVDGQPSTIEMLASSKNLSDFVDKEEYRNSVQNKIQTTLAKITTLQNQVKEQKVKVDQLLADQQTQQAQLDADRSQQAQLLAYNESQQSSYNQQIKSNQSKIASLRQQQIAENARLFAGAKVVSGGACDTAQGDTYPAQWCGKSQDSVLDSWGYV